MSLFTRKEELTLTFDGKNMLSFLKMNNNAYQDVKINAMPLTFTIVNNGLESKDDILSSLQKTFKQEITTIKEKSKKISDEELFLNLILLHGVELQKWMEDNGFQFKNEHVLKFKIKDLNHDYHNDFLHYYNQSKKYDGFNEEKALNEHVGVIYFLKSSIENFHPISRLGSGAYDGKKELEERAGFYIKSVITPEKNYENYVSDEYKNKTVTSGIFMPENFYDYNFATLQHLFHANKEELEKQIILGYMGSYSHNNLFGTLQSYDLKDIYLEYEKGETERKFIKEFVDYIQEKLKEEGGEIITYNISPTPYYNKIDDENYDFEQYDLFIQYKAREKIQDFYKIKDGFYQHQKMKSKIDEQVKNKDQKAAKTI